MLTIETTPNGVAIYTGGQVIKVEPPTLQEANRIAAAFRMAHRHLEKIEFLTPARKKRVGRA